MKFDELLEEIGEFGPYQKRIYFLVCLTAIVGAYQSMSPVFLLEITNYRCKIPFLENDTYAVQDDHHKQLIEMFIPKLADAYSKCTLYDVHNNSSRADGNNSQRTCDAWVYDKSVIQSSGPADFNMFCDNEILRSHSNMIDFAGALIGALVCGPLGDRFGRKKVLIGTVVMNSLLNVAIALSTDFAVFAVFNFMIGFTGMAMFMLTFVLAMEFVGPCKRTFAGVVIEYFWTAGLFLLTGLAYLIRQWRHLRLALGIPQILFVTYWCSRRSRKGVVRFFFHCELHTGMLGIEVVEEVFRVVVGVENYKGVVYFSVPAYWSDGGCQQGLIFKFRHAYLSDDRGERTHPWNSAVSATKGEADLRAMSEESGNVLSGVVVDGVSGVDYTETFAINIVYYGLSLNVGNLSGDIYLNFFISSLMELLGYIVCHVLMNRVGRKTVLCSSMVLGGLTCISSLFPLIHGNSSTGWILRAITMAGKLGATTSFAVIYIFSAELFPTTLRQSAMGSCSLFEGVAGMIAPYIADLGILTKGPLQEVLPLMVFGSLSIAAGMMAILLPETRDEQLPETLVDAILFGQPSPRQDQYSDEVQVNQASYF
ncbi:organic cation transporter protein-like [Haliotis rubra]|uniref:organic cation transporter protein-like n=1 Tax=Haliotis rubra TaxID=36100 RepID=UPI001EE63478|nr:organic cation transporter protein-like [Haliotis rubra]